jgi:citrate synthase
MPYRNPEKYAAGYWKTAISQISDNAISIRGYPLDELTGQISYVDAIILCIRGELPGEIESRAVNAIFTAALDHQFLNSTALAARVVASANPDPIVAIAAGILAFGKVTAGVPSYVVEMIDAYYPGKASVRDSESAAVRLVDEYRSKGQRIWGFGHPLHSLTGEHYTYRSQLLRDQLELAGLPVDGKIAFYETVHTAFLDRIGRPLPINVDGVIGAGFAELGYSPLEVQGLAPFTLLPGIVAHALEEIRDGVPLRIVPESEYVGRAARSRYKRAEDGSD